MKKLDSKISTHTEKGLEESINVESLNQKLEEKIPEVEKRGGKTYSELEQMNEFDRWVHALENYPPQRADKYISQLKSGKFTMDELWDYLELVDGHDSFLYSEYFNGFWFRGLTEAFVYGGLESMRKTMDDHSLPLSGESGLTLGLAWIYAMEVTECYQEALEDIGEDDGEDRFDENGDWVDYYELLDETVDDYIIRYQLFERILKERVKYYD
ncbi:hypothetical protein [[Muricauda] lutisoli]|uniref:DUF4375 domain-containing protein n=1 Tax=[Muricauda] lutisoli TaxID=2816035 RepID=A0ABS3EU24_9FLAO|nr:hypothetical protein [[Muricauda] lutisoli]MBO0329759.1 hypothetical protein [[Muricauda] lutisoli]